MGIRWWGRLGVRVWRKRRKMGRRSIIGCPFSFMMRRIMGVGLILIGRGLCTGATLPRTHTIT